MTLYSFEFNSSMTRLMLKQAPKFTHATNSVDKSTTTLRKSVNEHVW